MLFTRKPKWIAFVFVIFFSAFNLLSFSQETIYGKGWTVVDRSGRIYATALDYFDIQEFHKGAAKAQVPGGFCLIDIHGNKLTGTYSKLEYAVDGTWKFRENDQHGIISSKGIVTVDPQYDWIAEFHGGLAAAGKNYRAGYIDTEGNIVSPFEYETATSFSGGVASVKKNGKWGVINKKGETVVPFKYVHLSKFSAGLAAFSYDEEAYGYINTQGNVVLQPEFTYAEPFDENGYASVSKSEPKPGAFGSKFYSDKYFIDTRGNVVDSPVESNERTGNKFMAREYKGKTYLDGDKRWQLYDKKGDLLFNNVFVTSKFGEPNQFSGDGYAALKIENQKHICDGIKGPSPWGTYEIACTRAKASEASYILSFEDLVQEFNISEKERSYRLSLGPQTKEIIDLVYTLKDDLVYLDTVDKGGQFFRAGEVIQQKEVGIPYYDAPDILKVVIDQFLFLLEPEILFRTASPGSAELRQGGYLYVNGVRQKGLDEMETIDYEGGQSYTGETENDQLSGFGKYVFNDGARHYGTFSNNTFDGWGLRVLTDGRSFLGVFNGNAAEGYLLQHTGYGETFKRLLTDGEYDGRVLAKLLSGQIEIRKIENNEIVSTEVLRDSPDFAGIGIVYRYSEEKDGYYVEQAGEGLPAYKAGMKAGDRILTIDGETVEEMNIKEVTNRLRGPHGSEVEVTVERDRQIIDLSITRERIEVDKLGSGY